MTLARLQAAWRRSDRLFGILHQDAWLEQPIALRQPLLFYLGHLPAFAWNHLARGVLGEPSFEPELDSLFERGIDPVGTDAYVPRARWPERSKVLDYRDAVRRRLVSALGDPGFPAAGAPVVSMVVEHELMHHETLLYMFQELDHGLKSPPADWPGLPPDAPSTDLASASDRSGAGARTIEVPSGEVCLGAARGALPFGWDNEFPQLRVTVPAFELDDRPVTNAAFLAFVQAGGYRDARLWRAEDWSWRQRRRLERPHGWRGAAEAPCVRGLLEDVPFERAARWPAVVSWAEATAYARWRGTRLPGEAEWQRASEGATVGEGTNVEFRHGSPLPVGSDRSGASRWGVLETIGNGWEWTATAFAPFPGFEPLPRYPGYSADFFDGSHFVLRGGSWATDRDLLRPSFRNWFQPHYPYVFSKFRCARSL